MGEKGFAIRCPHCQGWTVWPESRPEDVAVTSKEDLEHILDELQRSTLRGKEKHNCQSKLLRCSSPLWFCPASFQAFICKGYENVPEFLGAAKSWSFKREFRLYKSDCHNRWEGYYGILFCIEPVPRLRNIELGQLIDPEQLSRLIVGISAEIEGPLTVYSANVFEPENKAPRVYWMPIEEYSESMRLVPGNYNKFCQTSREIVMNQLVRGFVDAKVGLDNCPIGFAKGNMCAGKAAACMRSDWNRCPAFIEERKENCPCYRDDLELISEVINKWRYEGGAENEVTRTCGAGFTEVAFPLVAQDFLVGVAMAGQTFSHPKQIVDVKAFAEKWKSLRGYESSLEEAKGQLLSKQLGDKSRFLISPNELSEKLGLLRLNIQRVRVMADSRYRDICGRSEFAFRQELLGFIRNHKIEPDFFEAQVSLILKRMREFWAFEAAYLVGYSFETKEISVIAMSTRFDDNSFGIPGRKVQKVEVKFPQMHPIPYLHKIGGSVGVHNSFFGNLLTIFETVIKDPKLTVPASEQSFLVLIPFMGEIYMFVFMGPDKDYTLEHLTPGSLSELSQEAILETCTEAVYEFGDVRYREAREQAWREFSALASHRIGNEISSVNMMLKVLSDQLLVDSEWAKKWGDKLTVMQKCIERAKRMLTEQVMLTAEIKPELKKTNLENLIRRSVLGVLPSTASLNFRNSTAQKEIFMDPDLMEQAFRELATNAIHASGEIVHLTIEVNAEPEVLCISFQDNGPGIDTEQASKMFEPYVKSSGFGTGLGLPTVRRIIEAHRGSIQVSSSSFGTKFIIKIPSRGDEK